MWQTPKTDWHGSMDADGIYTGDRFNAADFNRIKNNLVYLRELAILLYNEFAINDVGEDRAVGVYFYADEINDLEENLATINSHSVNGSYGNAPQYAANGHTMDFAELNRLEGATLDLYDKLTNQREGKRNFTWNFGMKGGI